MVERITVRFDSLDSILLQDLDIRAESHPDACSAGKLSELALARSQRPPDDQLLVTQIEFIYNAIQLLFTWTSLANFYLAFFFVSTKNQHFLRDTER